jgi:hypothetical protein
MAVLDEFDDLIDDFVRKHFRCNGLDIIFSSGEVRLPVNHTGGKKIWQHQSNARSV